MIVNVIEIFTEYLSIIMCMHRIAEKKMSIDRYVVKFSLLNLVSVIAAYKYQEAYRYIIIIVYINFVVYAKMRLAEKWINAIKIFGLTFVFIPCIQLIAFYIIKFIFLVLNINQSRHIMGFFSNCIVCIVMTLLKKECIFKLLKKLGKAKGVIVALLFCFFSVYLLQIYKKADYVYESVTLQLLAIIVSGGAVGILWINAENEKKMKVKDLQLYELYNKTFEEAISAIRIRQHEFENHINAIKCLQFTIHNPSDLVKAQNEYCDKVLKENSFNRLLKLEAEPILTGFLYSKFMKAREQEIEIIHEVHVIEFRNKIQLYELIEVIGILLDNAVEALLMLPESDRVLIVKLLQDNEEKFSIEIANRSRRYLNSEIERFSIAGYSTKGKNRGMGLSRVKDIVNVYSADWHIENVRYNEENYLSFKIIF